MSGRPSSIFLRVFVALVALFLMVPSVVIVIMSFSSGTLLQFPPPGFGFRWYENFFQSDEWTGGAITSAKIGAASAVLATALGTLTALGVVRGRFPGRSVVTAVILSPMIVPIVVIAVGMYFVYSDWGLSGSLPGLIVGHTALTVPFVVVIVSSSLRTLDRNLELAAESLGAGPIKTFLRVTLPLILPAVLTGAIFSFIISWDEVIVSLFLSSPFTRTLPVVIWAQVRSQIDPTVAAVGTMLTAMTVVVLLLALLLQRWTAR